MSKTSLDETLDFLAELSTRDLQYEVKVLRAVQQWTLDQLGIRDGDKVEIIVDLDLEKSSGWYHCREALAVGATAIAKRVEFNEYSNSWYADLELDREWTVGSDGYGHKQIRRWHGPAEETPEGYETPSSYDQEAYPGGRKHVFMMALKHLRKIEGE